jgi:hypothetical protein
MKKLLVLGAVFGLCVVPSLAQTTLQVRVVTTGDAATTAVDPGDVVPVMIQAQLGGTPTDGLALVGLNLEDESDQVDLCNQTLFLVTAPTSPVDIKAHFDRNGGLTNPPGGPVSGFSGTCDGALGLWQLGGGQNTIGNTGTPVNYPSGTVLEGVANGGWVTIASGTLLTPAAGNGTIVVAADTVFANTLDAGQTGPVYDVSEVASGNISAGGTLTITVGVTQPDCAAADVNCDGSVNTGDLLSVRAPGTWGTSGPNGFVRADVNNDGAVNTGDLLSVRAPGVWGTSTGAPCNCLP